jgi:signal transduction histidine kinase
MVIISLIFAYAISNDVVYRIFNKNFEKNLEEKSKDMSKVIFETGIQLRKESKFLSWDKDLKYFLRGGYITDRVEGDEITGQYISYYKFKDRRKHYYILKSGFQRRLKEYFDDSDGIEVNIIDSDGVYIYERTPGYYDDKKEIERVMGKEDGTPKEMISYIKDGEGNIILRTYSPILNEDRTVMGAIAITFQLDKKFLDYLKNKIQCDFVVFDSNEKPKIVTFKDGIDKIRWRKDGELEYNKDLYDVRKIEIKDVNSKIIGYIGILGNETEMYNGISEVSAYLFVALLFVFAVIFMVSTSVLNILVDSIKELTMKINSLREGNFTVNLKDLKSRNDEIGILAEEFEDMVNTLKNKIEIMEKIGTDNRKYSEKLESANLQLAGNKKELEEKNKNIDRINKMLNSRITEISNLYYLIINISKYMADDKFYSIGVRGIREGLHIRKVVVFEFEDGKFKIKAKAGVATEKTVIECELEFIERMKKEDIIRVDKYEKWAEWEFRNLFKVPYIIPLKTGEEIYGGVLIDNDSHFDDDTVKAITTYSKTITLAFENRKLYMKLIWENDKLENTTKKLMESEKLKNIFLANVSHELKVPLVPIKGYAELMLDGVLGDISVSQRKSLIISINNVERLQDIIENILSYSRIESGKYELINKNFNLIDCIDRALEHLDGQIEKKNIKIIKAIENIESIIYGDKEAITQVFLNIISNSIKFSENTGKIKIFIGLSERDYDVVIEDYGVGMDREKIKLIFESFKQLEEGNTRKYGGLGLGLTVAQRILEYYNKTLAIESSPNEGAKISFSLPKRHI